jgi:hypothetical protein
LGSFRNQYRIDRPGGNWEQPGNMAPSRNAEGTLPPDAVRQRNCQPRLPAGEPDTRFPAVYYGLFPCSEGVGGTAHRNPGLVHDVCVNHRCGYLLVPQQFLDGPDVGPGLQKVGGK